MLSVPASTDSQCDRPLVRLIVGQHLGLVRRYEGLEGLGLTIAGGDLKRAWPMCWQTFSAAVTLWRGHKSVSKPERAARGIKKRRDKGTGPCQ